MQEHAQRSLAERMCRAHVHVRAGSTCRKHLQGECVEKKRIYHAGSEEVKSGAQGT